MTNKLTNKFCKSPWIILIQMESMRIFCVIHNVDHFGK